MHLEINPVFYAACIGALAVVWLLAKKKEIEARNDINNRVVSMMKMLDTVERPENKPPPRGD